MHGLYIDVLASLLVKKDFWFISVSLYSPTMHAGTMGTMHAVLFFMLSFQFHVVSMLRLWSG